MEPSEDVALEQEANVPEKEEEEVIGPALKKRKGLDEKGAVHNLSKH